MNLEAAMELAVRAHVGQRDKAGAPYILHALRVMLGVATDTQRIVAVLHDVVEDSDCSLADLRASGFSEEIVEAVDALIRRPDEEYLEYVARAAANDIARVVKLSNLRDNMNMTRPTEASEKDRERGQRYARAARLVRSVGRGRGDPYEHPEIAPLVSAISASELEEDFPGPAPIFACDFYVAGAEHGVEIPGGIDLGRVINVDHHAPLVSMQRYVTSTALAAEYLAAKGPIDPQSYVVINHTDCDSILSSALLMGLVDATDEMVTASIAADHTGEENAIADLLQAIDQSREGNRTVEQYADSLRNLHLLMDGEPLESQVRRAVDVRRHDRAAAAQFAVSGQVQKCGLVAFGVLDAEVEGAFLPGLFPDCAIVAIASRHRSDADRWVVKVRLGASAPQGMTLRHLNLQEFDPAFGGRWNAGSNKRGGGSAMEPEAYLAALDACVRTYVEFSDADHHR